MREIERDIVGAQEVYSTRYSSKYNKIYFSTNEQLSDLFKNIDIKNKDVLTVLGSGDQSFFCYQNDAKSVDVFDINKLTIYYYYLRIWTMEHLNSFYPKDYFDKSYIINLLSVVVPKTKEEKDSYDFWSKFVNKFFIDLGRFFYSNNCFRIEDYDLEKIKSRLANRDFNYYNLDISSEWNHDKKYDVIVTSNISDYIPKKVDSFVCYRDNLDNLLRDDGIILCSKIGQGTSSCERDTFKEKFIRRSFPKEWICGKLESPGFSYKRR